MMERRLSAWRFSKIVVLLGLCLCLLGPSYCAADVIEGQAAILNGNLDAARQQAREDAMRAYVEQKVGVHIQGTTEVDMGMVVSDHILAQSDGYVQINRIVKEWQSGGIYYIQMDLTASDQKIATAVRDIRSRIEAIQDEGTTRSGVQVAVTGRDEMGRPEAIASLQNYVMKKLADAGFHTYANDAVLAYMNRQTDLGDAQTTAEIRRIARNSRMGDDSGNSLLRGTLSVAEVRSAGAQTVATVHASFELIGLDSSEANNFDDYATAVGASCTDAIRKAQDSAVRHAVESLAQSALSTVQSEFRGGVHQVKTAVVVTGITDRTAQGSAIKQYLTSIGCTILRSNYSSTGALQIFLKTTSVDSIEELKEKILSGVPGLQEGNTDENAMGATKIYLTF